MITHMELLVLAHRIEAANRDDELQMMLEVGRALSGGDNLLVELQYVPAVADGDYLRAVQILLSDGYDFKEYASHTEVWPHSESDMPPHKASASTPALSLAAAYLRALAGKAK